MTKYRRSLHLLAFLSPFLLARGVVEATNSGSGQPTTETPSAPPPAPAAAAETPAPAKALSASDFMAKLTAAFTAKETLAKENAEQKKRISTLEQECASAKSAQSAAEARATAAETAAAQATTTATTLTATVNTLAVAVGLKPEALAGQSAEAVQQAFNARIEARSGERLAELGFPLSGLPASSTAGNTGGSGDELADIQEQLRTERDPVKAGQLAARANKLRDQQWSANSGRN